MRPPIPVRRQTLFVFFGLILVTAILELYPFSGRFLIEQGVPFVYGTKGLGSYRFDWDFLRVDLITVGSLVVVLTVWTERWMRWRGRPHNFRLGTAIFIVILAGGAMIT